MKLIQCSGVPEIYGELGVRGISAMGICAFFSYLKLIQCSGVAYICG